MRDDYFGVSTAAEGAVQKHLSRRWRQKFQDRLRENGNVIHPSNVPVRTPGVKPPSGPGQVPLPGRGYNLEEMIELTCPKCKSPLEIDDGFRGGVCRCFSCGTLMSVPDERETGPSESLTQSRSLEAQPSAAGSRAIRGRTTRPVRLSESQAATAPIARPPRRSVRVAVTAAVISVSVLLMAGVAVLAYVLFRPAPADVQADPYADLFDIEHNPYTWDEPNFMGLPVRNSTVMLIDSSAAMRDHLDLVKAAVRSSMATLGPDRKAQVIFWAEEQPWVYPGQMMRIGEIDVEALAAAMGEVSASGAPAPGPAFAAALRQEPDQITLVARVLPEAGQAAALAEQIKAAKVRLFIVHLDAVENDPDAADWKEVAKTTRGGYATLNPSRLRRWHEESLKPTLSSAPAAPR